MLSLRGWVVLLLALGAGTMRSGISSAHDVLPGYDLYATVHPTYQTFSGPFTIPAGFFGPGSDPFEGTVAFQGLPLGTSPFCPGDIGRTDKIVRRPLPAHLPGPGTSDVIPIEIVALSLVSVQPITVTYHGGGNPESWNVQMQVSSLVPSTGTMRIRHDFAAGGTFDSTLPVCPLFTFARDMNVRIMDCGLLGLFDSFSANNSPWAHDPDPNLRCPPCCTNFYPSWLDEIAPYAEHNVVPGCPQVSAGVPDDPGSLTWGAIKALYR